MKKCDYYNQKNIDRIEENYRPKRERKNGRRQRMLFLVFLLVIAIILGITGKYIEKKQSHSGITEAEVVRVVDGDTIIVLMKGQEVRVRMIGIDAPESVSSNEEENSIYGEMASQYTSEHLTEGMIIYMTYDIEQKDKYGRILAYIWLSNDISDIDYLYQKKMIEDGYAMAYTYEPNVMYRETFYLAMQNAYAGKKGLWAEEDFRKENQFFD